VHARKDAVDGFVDEGVALLTGRIGERLVVQGASRRFSPVAVMAASEPANRSGWISITMGLEIGGLGAQPLKEGLRGLGVAAFH
jgi:hypothetical protein